MPRRSDCSVSAHIGQKLKERRRALRLSQTAIAERIGISFQQIRKYERGTDHIGGDRLFALARALRVEVTWFFEDCSAPEWPSTAT